MVVITRSTIKFYITASLLLYFRSIVYLINNINNISSYKHDRHHDPHHGIRIGTVVVSGGDRLSSLSSTSFTMTTITAEEEDDDDDGHDSDARSSSSSHIIIQQDQQHEHEHEEEQEEEDDDDDEVDEDEYYPPGEERFDDDDDDDDQKLYQHRSLPKVFVISNPITDHWTKDGVDYLSTKLLRTYNPVEADIWIINMLETTATTATSAKNNKNDKNDDGVEEFNSNNTNTTIGYKNLTLPVSSNTFFKYVQHVHDQRVLHNITTTTPNFNSYSNSHQSSHKHLHSWKLFVMDTYDQGYKNYYNYLRKLSHIVGHFNVYYLRRAYTNHDRCIKHDKYSLSMMKLQNSICNASTTDVSKLPTVDDRNFISSTTNPSNDIPFYNLGTEFHDETEGKYHNGVTKILRLPVRTDFVHALNEILSEIQQNKVIMEKQQQHEQQQEEEEEEEHSSNETTTTSASNTTISTTSSTLPTAATTLYPYDIPRIKDVVHYWPHKIKGTSISKLQASLSTHRQRISQVLYQLSHSKYYMEQYPKNTNFVNRIDVGFVGTRGKKGRQQPQYTYLRDMLQYKIVVVCQKDLWEDHYRLMESLISGSLVFTDPMIPTTLPYKLQNGTNIIVYHSIQELIQYVQYYTNPNNEYERLTIAKNGYHVAMKYHRSYHIIERMIYGNYSNKIL